jgi:hypothetical protein
VRYGGVLGPPDVGDVDRPAAGIAAAAARSEDAQDYEQEETPKSRIHKLIGVLHKDTFV